MPHLWAYLAIGQILPISFAQSLFFIAMILVPLPDSARSMRVPSRLVQCLPLAAYYISVFSAVFSVGTPSFTSVIVVIRTLLFCPYLSRFSVLETRGSRSTTARDLHAGHSTSYKLTALLSIVLFVYQTRRTLQENEVNQVLAAINSNPAVSALGYDFIIHVVVSFTWFILNPELVDVST